MAALVGSSAVATAAAQRSVVSVAANPLFGRMREEGVVWRGPESTYVTPRSARVNFYTNIERNVVASTESSVFIDINGEKDLPNPKRDDVCIICMENFAMKPACRLACGCKLKYHEACIMAWLHTGNSCPQCRKIINPELEVVRRATRERRDAHTGNNNNARENNDNDDETESLWSSTVSTITTAGPTTWIFIVLIAFIWTALIFFAVCVASSLVRVR